MRLFQVQLTRARAALLAGLILLSFVGAAAVALGTPPTYTAKSEALLIGPSQVARKPTNPYLQFSPALSVTLDVLIVASSDSATAKQIVASGGTVSYTVVRTHAVSESEPIITVTGSASTPPQAIKTTKLVVEFITADLKRRQDAAQIAPEDLLKLVVITTPARASRVWKSPVEIGFGVLVLGVVGSLILFVVLDRYFVHRGAKRTVQRRPHSRHIVRPGARVPAAGAAIRRHDKSRIEVVARESADRGDQSEESGSRKRRVGIPAMRGRAADAPDVAHEDDHPEITARGSDNGDQSEESGSRKRRVGIRAMRGRGAGASSVSPEEDHAEVAGQDSAADSVDVSPGTGPQPGADDEWPARSGEEAAAKAAEEPPAASDSDGRPSESVSRRRRAGMRAIHGPVSGPASRALGADRVEVSARTRSNDSPHASSENGQNGQNGRGHQTANETDSARAGSDARASQVRPPN